ncbi:MAG: HEAT repeat domain-containing protein [Deltaproteobacteria bacterium]|nr:HEAT repeat domain-containing protein [Deltaproteobacteria bacterium]
MRSVGSDVLSARARVALAVRCATIALDRLGARSERVDELLEVAWRGTTTPETRWSTWNGEANLRARLAAEARRIRGRAAGILALLADHHRGWQLLPSAQLRHLHWEVEDLGGAAPDLAPFVRVSDGGRPFARCELDGVAPSDVEAELLAELASGDVLARRHAAHALGGLGMRGERTVLALAATRADPDPEVRRLGTQALIRAARDDRRTSEAVASALGDAVGAVRLSALVGLFAHLDRLWPEIDAGVARAPVMRILERDRRELRESAAGVLGFAPYDAPGVEELLVRALREDRDVRVRCRVARSLLRRGSTAPAVVAALRHALVHDPHEYVRKDAAEALGVCGRGDADAVADLQHALDDPDRRASTAATEALLALGVAPRTDVARLLDAIEPHDGPDRGPSAEAIAKLGVAAVPALIEAIELHHRELYAISLLARLGPAAGEALPLLEDLAGEPDPLGAAARASIAAIRGAT